VSLTDNEILELNELCSAAVDGMLSETQQARLARWLAASEEARQFYVRATSMSASLFAYAGEMQAEAPDAVTPPGRIISPAWRWWTVGLAAAVIAVLFWMLGWPVRRAEPDGGSLGTYDTVARITGVTDCRWGGPTGLQPGDPIRNGQRLELAAGLAEITFDSGARIVLNGPAVLKVNSAWDASLRRGTLKASVPPEALGFRVANRTVQVVDLGTEFTMSADPGGSADVYVVKGEVEATPLDGNNQNALLLRKDEARRFANTGVSEVSDPGARFAPLIEPLLLNRLSLAADYAHWSFDEAAGRDFAATVVGRVPGPLGATIEAGSEVDLARAHVGGRRGQALQFDGKLFVKTSFPGIAGDLPRTVAFWVKVPGDAPLSDAYSMVAWHANLSQLAYRPVHISWNRNPNEGALGALRTDFGGGCAIGTTSLRDGRWHYVAVVFVPGRDAATPLQVKQYVDGRLESSGIIPGRTRGPAGTDNPALADTVWLGCRLGNTEPRLERFHGEMDELFIVDRALVPGEIVALMNDNRLYPSNLVGGPHSAVSLAVADP
jgi:ferric-dicitrate binding protein FerR (iron transport regulator)